MKGVMKGSILFLFFSTISIIGFGQAPDLISYQAIIRNSNNELVSNVSVGTRISILRGSAADVLLYQEEHNVKTNLNGLIYLNIGSGAPLVGTMSGIDWSKGPFYVKSETDPTGGKNYTLVVVSQLLSVPFSIYAKSAEKVTGPLTELDPLFNASISKGITAVDTAYWNKKLSSFMESDPLFNASVAKGITAADTALWNSESDPLFSVSISNGITAVDTAYWNKKLSSFTESDPLFNASIAKGITAADTALWNSEYDPLFNASIAKGITAADTALWNSEYDPLFNASIAKGITAADTSSWNQKVGLPQTGNTAGDILYWNGTAWVKIQQGLPGQGLFLSQTGIPVWSGPAFATLTTNVATSVTNITAISGGNITSDGGTPVTARGICWSTSPNPTVTNDSTRNGAGTGAFSSNISGLLGSTTYYVRAYAVNTTGVSYGNQITFTTPVPTPPSLTTTTLSSITSVSVATGGSVVNNGGAPITARGVVWDTLQNPVVTKNKSINGSINNIFLDTIRGLAGSRVYYVRSYATNSAGTGYGNEVSFTTLTPVVPTVTINPIDLITNVSARSGGAITSDGGAAILSKGIVWSTFPNPTISNSKTTDGSGLASFTSQMTGLLGDSVYYVRAYATNATGTGYSSQLNFTAAQAVLATVTTNPITSITSNSAISGGNVTASGGGVISARGVVWNTSPTPTLSHFKTTDGTGTGTFTSNLTSLTPPGTTYYVRAYVTNSIGTNYGDEVTFTTLAVAPTVITKPVTAITPTSATTGGTISLTGGAPHSEKGVVYSTTTNPTISNTKLIDNTVGLDWVSNITGLTGNTKYYVRAYATNVIGTSYGVLDSFTTGPILPIITTNPVATITSTTAISGGNISSNGGSAITARGIVWNKTGNPAVGTDSIRTDASTTTGSYTLNLGNLNAGITYYVRAYATNAVGIAYGNQLTFTTQPVLDTIGNQYTTITINGKEWFKENLKTTKYANGDSIENVPTAGDWGLRTSGAWAYYNNDLNNDSSLGKLYNWYAVTDVKGLCPTGWHVATDADWTSLTANYGTDANAGNELKATTLWTAPNSNTNSSNFGALPGGGRGGLNFGDLNNKGFWWTSTLFDASNSYARRLEYNTDTVIRYTESNKYGFSVRCVKN
ncbi:MAG: fibrobacter succinogenes major paralogous domain-containing protein [Saprospiraceae bacterium]|nr:fibrobacter succinogenes major paralogous domain-containing protein [Saprospiraceae bacterium]